MCVIRNTTTTVYIPKISNSNLADEFNLLSNELNVTERKENEKILCTHVPCILIRYFAPYNNLHFGTEAFCFSI